MLNVLHVFNSVVLIPQSEQHRVLQKKKNKSSAGLLHMIHHLYLKTTQGRDYHDQYRFKHIISALSGGENAAQREAGEDRV